jgi:transcriptional regulator with XRE-family HTH domain
MAHKEAAEMKGLSNLRKKKCLTQAKLAKEMGVEMNTVWKWENTQITPSIDMAQRLASYFSVSVDYLINGPAKRELEIITDLEGVGEMDAETIKANSVFCGYRGSDDSLIFRGAVPADGASERELIDATLDAVRVQMEAAYASRRVIAGE